MNRLQLSNYYGLYLGIFFLGQFLVLPILTPFMIAFGASIKEIAIIMATMGLTVMVLELPTGGLADKIGRKKVFLFSLLLNILSLVILFIWPNFYCAVIAMFFWGAGIALCSGTITAWFVETFNKADGDISLQEGLARVGLRTNGLGAIGALLCAGFMYFGGIANIDELTLYRFLLLGGLSCYVIVYLLMLVWVTETRTFQRISLRSLIDLPQQIEAGAKAVRHPILWRLMLTALLTIPLASAIEKYWPVQFELLSGEDPVGWAYGLIYAATLFLGSIAARVTTLVCKGLDQQLGKVLFVGLIFQLSMATVLALSNNLFVFALFFICYDFSAELGASAKGQLQHQSTQDNVRSTVDSISSLNSRIGGLIGTLLCGFGAAYVGLTTTWLVCVLLASLASVVYLSKAFNKRDEKLDISSRENT
ncbi:MFS transporter [Marinomonas sp. RSW2]|uniref:MFS transporter n=1 Tax=Marinomonas maritima TaxID=2940935 RepID=A0ABT5WGD8_9GAMM|nr:MFS transporter [Marinomonas maritima]MDE8603464.1 MFS transporter [Marinomonas maritima]